MATPFPRSLKAMIWLIAILAVLYAGAWLVASRLVLHQTRAALAGMVAAGTADPADLSIAGFPSRLDLTAAPVALRPASGAWEWQTPRLDAFAMLWQPTHLILAFQPEQRLRLGRLQGSLRVAEARASVNFGLSSALPLERAIFVARSGALSLDGIERLTGAAAGAPATGFDELRLATRALDDTGLRHELGVELQGLDLPPSVAERLKKLPGRIERLHLDAVATLDRPLDRMALTAPPRPGAIEIRDLSIGWGGASLAASGQVSLSTEGLLDGDLQLDAADWDALLDLMVAARLLDRDLAKTYRRALDGLAQLSGTTRDGHLQVPLTIREGFMRLGPLPLGYAPQLPPAGAF